MPSYQQLILVGHIGKDPEIKRLPSGAAIASFSIATTYKFKNKTTEQYEQETEWHDITFFGKSAEFIEKHAKKGLLCFVQGRMKTSVWTDNNGLERRNKKVMGDKFELLSPPPGGQQGGYQPQQQQGGYQQNNPTPPPQQQQQQPSEWTDDIPF